VLWRSLIVLGLTESIVEMTTFLTALSSAGWRVGSPFPSGPALLSASGAAFTAVVAGQMANAFACRSARLSPGRLGWFSNRFLVIAVLCEGALLFAVLYVRPIANLLGHAPPSAAGYVAAFAAIPCVFIADAIQKRYRVRTERR